MPVIIGLLPALAWGMLPIAASKFGGKPANQILGTTAGTFLVSFFALLYYGSEFSAQNFVLSMLSGACWVVGQIGQFSAFGKIGVSKTMPISTGLQLVGTSLIGVFIFGEWPGLSSKIFGFAALAIVILGVFLTSRQNSQTEKNKEFKKTLLLLFLTTFGFLGYSSIPNIVESDGLTIFFPQALGMIVSAVLYLLLSKQQETFQQKSSWKNIFTGIIFAIAAISYIISAQLNGIATGFILAQLSVVISTLGGIFILKEEKSKKQLLAISAGLVLILIGEIMIISLK